MAFKVGICRSLLYFKYFSLWDAFFNEIGAEVVVSTPTGKRMLNRGLEVAENELCLPIKSFFGHALSLADKVDYIFVPRVVSVDSDGYTCPKLLGLPDMVENLIKDLRISTGTKVLAPVVDATEDKDWDAAFAEVGNELGCEFAKVREATKKAARAQKAFQAKLLQGFLPTEVFLNRDKQKKAANDLTIGVLGHGYLLYDSYLSMNLIKKIRERGAYIITPEMVAPRRIRQGVQTFSKPLYWNFQKEVFGAGWFLARQKLVDGIIYLPAFPCGSDSVIGVFIESEAKKNGIPLTPITVDEHAGEAGIDTRIEAFVDMIRRRKRAVAKNITDELPTNGTSSKRKLNIARKDMVVSYPRMGKDTHLILEYIFGKLGVQCLSPPPTSERTMRLGIEYAPETICLPMKLNLGNYIEALEAGANVLVHAGGCGPCRFGLYASLAESILREEFDYDFRFEIMEPPGAQGVQTFADFFRFFWPGKVAPVFLPVTKRVVRRAASLSGRPWIELLGLTPHDYKLWQIITSMFAKKRAFDIVERKALEVRCYEVVRGDTTRALETAREWINQADTRDEIEESKQEGLKLFAGVSRDASKDVLRVGLVGEFFTVLEPFINFDIEEWLGSHGVFIERGVYASDWIAPTSENEVGGIPYDKLVANAYPYLKFRVGGEGITTVGHAVLCAKHGYDGVIHLMPFTCMPETVAKQILPSVSHEQNIPVLSLVIDEQTGKAGLETRLEAFVDLMKNRKQLVRGGRVQ